MGFATGKKRMAPAALAAVLALAVAGCGAKPVTVDPTPYLSVEFFAAAYGDGVEDAAGLAACVDGSLDKAEGLSNGDTVTFQWNCDAETAQQEHNAVLAPEDAAFTVEGLDEWVTALDQIGQTDWDTLAAAGEEALRQKEGDSILSADCLGGYMLVRQDFSSEMVDVHNMLYAAYKVEAQLPDGSTLTYYAGVGFGDLVLHGDGSVEATGDYGFLAYGNIDVKVNGDYYNFTGFETLEDMNTECIDGYSGMYSVESNVTEA